MKITKYGDIGTPEILKRKGLKIELIEGQPRARRVDGVSPIHTMHERGYLTIAQFSAGKKLYECWIAGWGENGSCEIQERVDGGGSQREMTTNQIAAQREFEKGKKAGKREWDLINQVVVNEIPLTRKGMGGQERARLIFRFRNCLNDIAKCYGFMQ